MKLVEILNIANAAYPDDCVAQYYDPETGEKASGDAGDTLAKFIAIEIIETYDAESSDQEQIAEARRVINRAASELNAVASALYLNANATGEDTALTLLRDAVDQWAGRFESEEDINGADAVDWLGEFIEAAGKVVKGGAEAKPCCRELLEIIARMKTEQEFIDEGGELADDDSINALDELIASARKITGITGPETEPVTDEERSNGPKKGGDS